MKRIKIKMIPFTLIILFGFPGCNRGTKEIERPAQIVSMRQIVYDQETYKKLAELWKNYNREFPSENAYANWMYAARYAADPNYDSLLKKGIRKYPANPVLLYLSGMCEHGRQDDLRGQHLLEKAIAMDPAYMDPWFALVIHYLDRDPDKMNIALRKILESGVIPEEIMDYSYNMLASLKKNAILITNGDNDTYPGWILTRLLNYRPDVNIVNRSLLNTDWYPFRLPNEGLQAIITQNDLEGLQTEILNEYKAKNLPIPPGGPFSDTLLVRVIESAERMMRPVYFAVTLSPSQTINRYRENGQNLGLVTLVTPTDKPYSTSIETLIQTWLRDYRTGGLDSWRLHHGKAADSGRKLVTNYFYSLHGLMDDIIHYASEDALDLFHWYQVHLMDLAPLEKRDEMNQTWCKIKNSAEIQDWCRDQGYLE